MNENQKTKEIAKLKFDFGVRYEVTEAEGQIHNEKYASFTCVFDLVIRIALERLDMSNQYDHCNCSCSHDVDLDDKMCSSVYYTCRKDRSSSKEENGLVDNILYMLCIQMRICCTKSALKLLVLQLVKVAFEDVDKFKWVDQE